MAAAGWTNDDVDLFSIHQANKQIVEMVVDRAGIPAEKVKKLYEGRPNILDLITNGDIQLIVNTPAGKDSVNDDSYLRKAAIKARIPYITTVAAAAAAADGIRHVRKHGRSDVKALQTWHESIK